MNRSKFQMVYIWNKLYWELGPLLAFKENGIKEILHQTFYDNISIHDKALLNKKKSQYENENKEFYRLKKSVDYTITPFKYNKQFANKGFFISQFITGYRYEMGQGVEKNYNLALKFYEESANQEFEPAIFRIGLLYYHGLGVKRKLSKAYEYFNKAASLGSSDAKIMIGLFYRDGCFLEQNPEKAFELFREAAKINNNETAKYHLSSCYYYGYGIEKDDKKALKWMKSAAKNDYFYMNNLGLIYYNGDGVRRNYKKAVYCFKKATKETIYATKNLGLCYYYGYGVKQDYKLAYDMFLKAAKQNNAEAQHYLGVMLASGKGIDENLSEGFIWIKKAADQGLSEAQNDLSEMFRLGLGISQDMKKAVYYLTKACENNNANALFNLGRILEAKKDFEKAFNYYKLAAEQNHARALVRFGLFYMHGLVVDIDYEKAFELFNKAIGEHIFASFCIGYMYYHGLGVTCDYEKAFQYIKKSESIEFPDSLYYLGLFYYYGKGQIIKDKIKAQEYFQKAVSIGHQAASIAIEKINKGLDDLDNIKIDFFKKNTFTDHSFSFEKSIKFPSNYDEEKFAV